MLYLGLERTSLKCQIQPQLSTGKFTSICGMTTIAPYMGEWKRGWIHRRTVQSGKWGTAWGGKRGCGSSFFSSFCDMFRLADMESNVFVEVINLPSIHLLSVFLHTKILVQICFKLGGKSREQKTVSLIRDCWPLLLCPYGRVTSSDLHLSAHWLIPAVSSCVLTCLCPPDGEPSDKDPTQTHTHCAVTQFCITFWGPVLKVKPVTASSIFIAAGVRLSLG